MLKLAPSIALDPSVVLAKAATKASELLGLSGAALARTIGVSEPTVSRLVHGDKQLNPASKEGELALLLVRVYRSLDALVADASDLETLGGQPRQLIQKAEGLVSVLNYLDGMRATA